MSRTAILNLILFLLLLTAAAFADVSVNLPDTTGYPNDTLSVPVSVSDLMGLEVYSYQFSIKFDSSVVKMVGVDSAGTLSEPWGKTWLNLDSAGAAIGNYGVNPLKGHGVLIYLRFKIRGEINDSTRLVFQDFEFNAGNPAVKLTNGVIEILHPPISVSFRTNVTAPIRITVDGIEKRLPFDTTWAYGSSHSIGTSSPQSQSADIRFTFNNWSDGGSMVHSVAPLSSTTFTLFMNEEYLLAINSTYGTVQGGGWYVRGTTATFSVDSLAQQTDSTRYIFRKWNGAGASSYTGNQRTASIVMNDPVIETAEWTLQYHLKIDSPYGNPVGAGWHDQGATVLIAIDSLVSRVAGTRYIFDAWLGKGLGSYSGPKRLAEVTMSAPIMERPRWKTEHYLTVKSHPEGIANFTRSGWFAKHQTVVTDTARPILALPEMIYSFLYWRVDGKTVAGSAVSIVMDTSHVAQAYYQIDSVLVTITTNIGAGTTVSINGTKYPAPYSQFWPFLSERFVGIDSIQVNADQKTRYLFRSWSDRGAQFHTVRADSVLNLTALLATQHFLSVDSHPAGLIKFAEAGWHDQGATVRISSVPAQVMIGQETLNFKGWYLDKKPVAGGLDQVVMDSYHTAIAAYKDLFFIKGQIADRRNQRVADVVVILAGASQDTVTISETNEYAFNLLVMASYQITPYRLGFRFEPPSRSYSALQSSLSDQNFVAIDTLKPNISLLHPNGGEQLKGATIDTIRWQAEDNMGIDSISIDWSSDAGTTWQAIARLSQPKQQFYIWNIPDLLSPKCQIRVSAVDFDGNPALDMSDAPFSITASSSVGDESTATLPATFAVQQNYPNPFNSATVIRFQLPEASSVRIKIFNMMGQEIVTLVDQQLKAGYHQVNWDGKDQAGKIVSSGVYFYRVEANSQMIIRKLLYVR